MDFDDIVVGSGLAALGTVLGLSAARRVLVIGGPAEGMPRYYDGTGRVPCAYVGHGGLGNYWHGVIPTAGQSNFGGTTAAAFVDLFRHFYPGTDVSSRLGEPWLFVPWRPIRPRVEWRRLLATRAGRLQIAHEIVSRVVIDGASAIVHTQSGAHRAGRVWICAGTLQSAELLERSLSASVCRDTVSDHVVCYLGQIDRRSHPEVPPPRAQRTREGAWFEARYDDESRGLYTLRPARFAFRRLDCGIEQRAAFGLPAAGVVAKILRHASPGLLAEALYNRTGLFPNAAVQSVYAQIVVPDAHWRRAGGSLLEIRSDTIRKAVDLVRAHPPWTQLLRSRRPEMFIPAIHLHHSVHEQALRTAGVNTNTAVVQVVDASVREHIGPEHHSFKMMLSAAERARSLSA